MNLEIIINTGNVTAATNLDIKHRIIIELTWYYQF